MSLRNLNNEKVVIPSLETVQDDESVDRIIPKLEDVDEKTYADLQKLVRKDIKDRFQNSILPVQWDDIIWRKLNNKDEIYHHH